MCCCFLYFIVEAGLSIQENERFPNVLSRQSVLSGSNCYAPHGWASGGREPRPLARLQLPRSMAHYWSRLPAIGRFVISLGWAAIFAASLTCFDRTDRRWLRGGPLILGLCMSEIYKDSGRYNRNPELT